jgi:tetratricopeptide (TPR) repeat protein
MPVIESRQSFEDDWVQVDFNQPVKREELKSIETKDSEIQHEELKHDEQWVMQKPVPEIHPLLKEEKITERGLEDEYFADEFEEEGELESINASSISSDAPIVSHTLIDLYCAQHYYDKAIELLEKILELNPDDEASQVKLRKVKQLKLAHSPSREELKEEDGHQELISIIETQVKTKSPDDLKIKNAFNEFLIMIKDKASEYRDRA